MLRFLAFGFISLVMGVVLSVLLINSGWLNPHLEQEIHKKTGVPVTIGALKVAFAWPPRVRLADFKANAGALDLSWKIADVVVEKVTPPIGLWVRLQQPSIEVKGAIANLSAGPEKSSGEAKPEPSKGRPMALRLEIVQGFLKATDVQVDGLDLQFAQKQLMQSPAKLNLKAFVSSDWWPGRLPVSMEGDGLAFTGEKFQASSIRAQVAGLELAVQGTSLLKDDRHRWLAEVKAPDLKLLPKPPLDLPASEWAGSLHGKAEIVKQGKGLGWQAEGDIDGKNLSAKLDWTKEDKSVKGPIQAEIKGKFRYDNEQILLPELEGQVDLSQAHVQVEQILNKDASVPLKFQIKAKGSSDSLEVQNLAGEFWSFKMKSAGSIGLKAPFAAKISLQVAPTSLRGLDALLIPLKGAEVGGKVALDLDWNGPLTDVWGSVVQIREMKLEKFAAAVNYARDTETKIQGPVQANVTLRGELNKGRPTSFQATGNFDLSSTQIQAGPMIKAARQPLKMEVVARGKGEAVELAPFKLTGFMGVAEARGTVMLAAAPGVQMLISMKPLDLSAARLALPTLRDLLPKGSLAGQLRLAGQVTPDRVWSDWPLVVSGTINAQLPEYLMAPPKAAAEVKGAPAPATKAASGSPTEGFLPKGKLTEKLDLTITAGIGVLRKPDLIVKGTSVQGRILSGQFRGGVKVREVFGGELEVKDLRVPLLDPLPTIQGSLSVNKLVVQEALEFAKPEYKEFAIGRVVGETRFKTQLPSDARFMEELDLQGQFKFDPLTLSTVKVGEILGDLVRKIPGAKSPDVKSEPMNGTVDMSVHLERQVVDVQSFVGVDRSGSELRLKGRVGLADLKGDLVGTFHWQNPPVKGCVLEGNSDPQGRLMVPLSLKGDLMKPQFGLVASAVDKMAKKTLECEAKNQVEKLKKDGGKKLEEEGKKLLKGILGN
ncbi:MAG: hypothetical protein AB7F86_14770 [Bdellovibrionales bacterium]